MKEGRTKTIRTHGGGYAHVERLVSVSRREKLSLAQTAYVLATAHHESRMGVCLVNPATGWGYEGDHELGNTHYGDGHRFRARGYVPILGRTQYAQWERRLKLPLLLEPELVAEPYVAAEIAVRGMMAGTFTGRRLGEFVNDARTDYLGARQVVSGRDRAVLIARYADCYQSELRELDPADPQLDVKRVQQHLRTVGWPLAADGVFGSYTRRALQDFQAGYTYEILPDHGYPDDTTVAALTRCAANGGYASPYFRYREFRTGGSLRLSPDNRVICVQRALIHGLERYREQVGQPVEIASGYRSSAYHLQLAGRPSSQHLVGRAVDLWRPRLPAAEVAAMGMFTAIGVRRGLAVHLEVGAEGSTAEPQIYEIER